MLKIPNERPEILPQLPVSRIYLRKVFSNEMMILHVFGDENDTSPILHQYNKYCVRHSPPYVF